MNAFFAGVIFGALFAGSVAVAFITRSRRPRREIAQWTDEHYRQPPVVTNVTHPSINRIREINL